MKSELEIGNLVSFPAFTAERVYMLPFFKRDGLPRNLRRWQLTVESMLDGISTDRPIYLMIDQGIIEAGQTHRRPGLHADGNWNPELQCHRGSGGTPGGHGHTPPPAPGHRHPGCGGHVHPEKPPTSGWKNPPICHAHGFSYADELIILASNISACRAIVGEFEGMPSHDGNCSHIDTRHGHKIVFEAGRVYRGNVTLLHESLPVSVTCERSLVRLNVPMA